LEERKEEDHHLKRSSLLMKKQPIPRVHDRNEFHRGDLRYIIISFGFRVWIFGFIVESLFLEILRKDPPIFRTQELEGHLAVRTHNKITRLLVTLQWDRGFANGTFQFVYHQWSPFFVTHQSRA
jgi:hypothetical protein